MIRFLSVLMKAKKIGVNKTDMHLGLHQPNMCKLVCLYMVYYPLFTI